MWQLLPLCLFAFFALVYADASIYCEETNAPFFQYNIKALDTHVGETVEDIESVLGGSKKPLATALKEILGDDSDFTRLKKAKAHLDRAKEVLARGYFKGEAKDWYKTGKARGGVSIFANARHLTFDKWPDHPDAVYSSITGVVRSVDDPWVEMYMDYWDSIDPSAFLIRDHDRPERFEKTGEILAVNPLLLEKWENDPYPDMLDTPITWEIATDRELYKDYNAVPANEPSDGTKCTPVDLLLQGPQPTLLHELFHSVPFGSLNHSIDRPSSGWKEVVLGHDPNAEKEDHPEILAVIMIVTRAYREGYEINVPHGTVHKAGSA